MNNLFVFVSTLIASTTVFLSLLYKKKPTKKTKMKIFDDSDLVLQIIVRQSLKMKTGKIIAQAGHAISWTKDNIDKTLNYMWRYNGEPIIALKASDEEIEDIVDRAKEMGLMYHRVYDAGRTQVAAGSNTVISIGPAPKNVIHDITGDLKLL